jgi:hypothetical protein
MNAPTLFVLVAALLLSPWAGAQDTGKVSREREALRRSQAALQEASAQRDALTAEKAAWLADKAALESELARSRQAAAAAQKLLARDGAESTRLRGELEAAQEAATLDRESRQAREAALRQQIAKLQAELAERQQTVAALLPLLERSTTALAAAESANSALFAAGLAAVERYRSRTAADEMALQDPLLGLRAVQMENTAQALRNELEKFQLKP